MVCCVRCKYSLNWNQKQSFFRYIYKLVLELYSCTEKSDHLSLTFRTFVTNKKREINKRYTRSWFFPCIFIKYNVSIRIVHIYSFLFSIFHRAYLRDVIEMVHIFFKLMENFCKGGVVVQKKSTKRAKRSKKSSKNKAATSKPEENLVSTILKNHITTWNKLFYVNSSSTQYQ